MDKKRKMGLVCTAKNCQNKSYSSKESFFRFPKDVVRATTWAIACGREDLIENVNVLHRSHRLCGAHFENKLFRNDLRNRLHDNAVPTIFPSLEGRSSASDEHSYCLLPVNVQEIPPISEENTVDNNSVEVPEVTEDELSNKNCGTPIDLVVTSEFSTREKEIESEAHYLDCSKICRTCLAEKEVMQTLFVVDKSVSESIQLSKMITEFTNVQIEDVDGFPSLICLDCADKANTAFQFKQLCEQSDTILRQYLRRSPIVKDTTDTILRQYLGRSPNVKDTTEQEDGVETTSSSIFVDNLKLDGSSDNHDENNVSNKDLSVLAEPFGSADTMNQDERLETTDCGTVSLVDNFVLNDSAKSAADNGDCTADKKAVAQRQLKKIVKLLKSEWKKPNSATVYQCDVCKRQFKYLRSLGKHLKRHIGDRLFKCKVCPRSFTAKYYLDAHMLKHVPDEQKPLECEVCKKRFNRQNFLTRHMLKHSGEKPFVCKICNKGCYGKNTLLLHMKIHERKHDDPKLLKHICDYCDSELPDAASLDIHIKQHTGDRPYLCNICGKSFPKKIKLNIHLRSHTDERPFHCDICNNGYISKDSLRIHMRTHTNERPFACEFCGKTFRRLHHVKAHKITHGAGKLKCNICGKKLLCQADLTVHLRKHTGERPFTCEICQKKYVSRAGLKVHMKLHSNETPFVCEFCGKVFKQHNSLTNHKLIHSTNKPECNICHKRYPTVTILKNHMRTHTGERPYLCNVCGRSFTVSINLIKHMRIHTGERPYVCVICGKAFTQSGTLHTHMKCIHHLPGKGRATKNRDPTTAKYLVEEQK